MKNVVDVNTNSTVQTGFPEEIIKRIGFKQSNSNAVRTKVEVPSLPNTLENKCDWCHLNKTSLGIIPYCASIGMQEHLLPHTSQLSNKGVLQRYRYQYEPLSFNHDDAFRRGRKDTYLNL